MADNLTGPLSSTQALPVLFHQSCYSDARMQVDAIEFLMRLLHMHAGRVDAWLFGCIGEALTEMNGWVIGERWLAGGIKPGGGIP